MAVKRDNLYNNISAISLRGFMLALLLYVFLFGRKLAEFYSSQTVPCVFASKTPKNFLKIAHVDLSLKHFSLIFFLFNFRALRKIVQGAENFLKNIISRKKSFQKNYIFNGKK